MIVSKDPYLNKSLDVLQCIWPYSITMLQLPPCERLAVLIWQDMAIRLLNGARSSKARRGAISNFIYNIYINNKPHEKKNS